MEEALHLLAALGFVELLGIRLRVQGLGVGMFVTSENPEAVKAVARSSFRFVLWSLAFLPLLLRECQSALQLKDLALVLHRLRQEGLGQECDVTRASTPISLSCS